MLAQRSIPSLHGLFDAEIAVRAGEIHDCVSRLVPAERAVIAHAVARRRYEFATGRLLAHALLKDLGFADAALLSAMDRTPIWPDGAVGSIAHAGSLCIVAVARSADVSSLGIDVEPCEPLDDELIPIVCGSDELDDDADRGLSAKRIYCIKEAVYKCWYPLTRVPLEFDDVTVRLDEERERFSARVTHDASPNEMDGRVIVRDGWILASATDRGGGA